MDTLYDQRRYLTDFDSRRTGNILADILVVGGGVAGARAAIEAAKYSNDVLLICKQALNESATRYAQGGIATVWSGGDSSEQHIADTLKVGCGLNRPQAVKQLIDDSHARITELIEWGMRFDQHHGQMALGREGGHSAARVLHFAGDATGEELGRTLAQQIRQNAHIRVFEECFLIDLLTIEGRCAGAVTFHSKYGHQLIWAKQTILGSGGCGRVYRETTNPAVATGDGLAAAYRAGALLADMEMVQFHPTVLYLAGASRALISEAVRGEGGLLVDRSGNRFMPDYHPDAELAPRDVVSRAIVHHMRTTRANCMYLDVRAMGAAAFVNRFPRIAQLCSDFQIDVSNELIPVRPAVHYMIGGLVSDLEARTSLDGLLCCGECACSGAHGANRLASNSLLEGLVFGAKAGETAGRQVQGQPTAPLAGPIANANPPSTRTELDVPDVRHSLRSLMWRNAGIERNGVHLIEAREIIEFWGQYVLDKTLDSPEGWEAQNMLTVGRLIVIAAHHRRQSLGVHFRADETGDNGPAPPEDDAMFHVGIRRQAECLQISSLSIDFESPLSSAVGN